MPHQPISIEQLRELINKGEAKDPIIFLESIMSGQDPRRFSSLYNLIEEIDSFTNGDITPADWSDIKDIVYTKYMYHIVPLEDSISASKTLAEYLHPKRSRIEMQNTNSNETNANNTPLTEDEIELFKERFNDEF